MPQPRRIEPGPGQESVWDYPRPPRLEPCSKLIRVEFAGLCLIETRRAYRVLETSHPPAYYVPPDDLTDPSSLIPSARSSFCEWKGRASYVSLRVGDRRSSDAAWCYKTPTPAFAPIRDYLAFYPSKVDGCWVDGVPVQAQPGDFYGGWLTPDIIGPFKGGPGTMGW